jgi:hypothetical protein
MSSQKTPKNSSRLTKIRNENLVSRRTFFRLATAVGAVAAGAVPVLAQAKPKYATPTISCGGNTQTSISITVTAGASGAPAGFSLQWMTAADYAANGYNWYLSDDSRLCKASFSGNANLSRYNLGPNQSVTVNVGEFLFDNGASSNCIEALVCGTEYVFRAFAHADNKGNRSDFTANLTCSTLPCGHSNTCTLTQGYWKTHGPVPTGNNDYTWPQSVKNNGLTLGSVSYTPQQLLDIFNKPAAGNGLIALAHQLIAAKINIANGADTNIDAFGNITTYINQADALIGGLVIPPVGSGNLASSQTSTLTSMLSNYNEGSIGPGHCGV